MANLPDPSIPPADFEAMYRAECEMVRKRRSCVGMGADPGSPLVDLRGLALSGGGIRSATFCLGVLQQLAQSGRLRCFDYLSTVSGGGFIGGWWSAWLSRPQRAANRLGGAGDSSIFPPPEGLEPERQRQSSDYVPDGSLSAGSDPIHHVRLFSNYLTPRKGGLSADTWRAITVISRNLLLTILTLLPILGSAIFAAQLYFVADKNLAATFVCGAPASGNEPVVPTPICQALRAETTPYPQALQVRAARALVPIVVLAVCLLVVTGFWAWFGTGEFVWGVLPFPVVIVMLILTGLQLTLGESSPIATEMLRDGWLLPLLGVGIIGMVLLAGWAFWSWRHEGAWSRANRSLSGSRSEVLTNRMTRVQSFLLVALSMFAVVLFVGGFGHEVVRYVFSEAREGLAAYASKAGGWAVVVVTGVGAVYTALKASPTGGADAKSGEPGRVSLVLFAVTPPLMVLVSMLGLATGAHAILARLAIPKPGIAPPLHLALMAAVLVSLYFAVYEFSVDSNSTGKLRWAFIVISVAAAISGYVAPLVGSRKWAAGVAGLGLGLVSLPWVSFVLLPWLRRFLEEQRPAADSPRTVPRSWNRIAAIAAVAIMVAAGYSFGSIAIEADARGNGHPLVTRAALAGMAFTAVFLTLIAMVPRTRNLRTMWLLTLGYALPAVVYVEQFLSSTAAQVLFPVAIVALIGVALATVTGFGWMIDPNYLSLHTFYKARLVRAYLGASNSGRRNSEITESVDGDDFALRQLATCERGGPYHLINTTLNLVAGRDLATAQRSAASFTLSASHCGSLRTGYRPTGEYMGGTLTLGAALAISGAAASPNMGSKTTSAALGMLLALLNVRLGYWAPNPRKSRWRAVRPRLWPFYIVQEFLSQTNDLTSYCYLTDGGHFDNTGLYSLVQRGCRSILLVDCGADPTPCFADLGDAIRRCRIDFRAEIALPLKQFIREHDGRFSTAHFAAGSIVYDIEHARELGWTNCDDEADRTGTIVWLKPSLLDPSLHNGDPAEVQQYSLENGVFPQQATTDQWFDEAQFESYRMLGMVCAEAAMSDADISARFPPMSRV